MLTGAAAVVSNSRGSSPIPSQSPVPTTTCSTSGSTSNGSSSPFFNMSTSSIVPGGVSSSGSTLAGGNNTATASTSGTGKPPLFLSTTNNSSTSSGNIMEYIIKPIPLVPAVPYKPTDIYGLNTENTTTKCSSNTSSSMLEGSELSIPNNTLLPNIRSYSPISQGSSATQSLYNNNNSTIYSNNSNSKMVGSRSIVLSSSNDSLASLNANNNDTQLLPHRINTTAALQIFNNNNNNNVAGSDTASVGSTSSSILSYSGSGSVGSPNSPATRKGSVESLTFTRIAPNITTSGSGSNNSSTNRTDSPHSSSVGILGIAKDGRNLSQTDTTEVPVLTVRRPSHLSHSASTGSSPLPYSEPVQVDTPPRSSSATGRSRRLQRPPSLAEQLAHLSAEARIPTAKTTDDLLQAQGGSNNSGGGSSGDGSSTQAPQSSPSFFSQSLNSAIAIGRSSGSSNIDPTTSTTGSSNAVAHSANNTLYTLPVKAFTIAGLPCQHPHRVSFYYDRCEYNYHSTTDNSVLSLVLYYKDMTSLNTVGTKLRFKAPVPPVGSESVTTTRLVTIELTSSGSMGVVREKVIPLVSLQQQQGQ